NEAWSRLHLMMPGIGARIDALESQSGPAVLIEMIGIATSWVRRASGDLLGALDAVEPAHRASLRAASAKVRWRTAVELAEVLLELGRLDDAGATLPDPSERADLQDVVYDAAPQIRLRLADGRLDEAVRLAREIADRVDRLAPYLETLAVAVEALVAAGLLDEAQAVVDAGRAYPTDPEPAEPPAGRDGAEPELVGAGERLVTTMFADVRGYTALTAATAPADLADRIETLHRWASAEVGRHHGLVDKFAGDAVMATFNT